MNKWQSNRTTSKQTIKSIATITRKPRKIKKLTFPNSTPIIQNTNHLKRLAEAT